MCIFHFLQKYQSVRRMEHLQPSDPLVEDPQGIQVRRKIRLIVIAYIQMSHLEYLTFMYHKCITILQLIVLGTISHVLSVMETGHSIRGAATNGSICAVR